ncbi:MAG: protease complex subunit PrcB family protein [Alphaproteobacteria bacterium]|nr:protease complex subunit PrcB family protein [Alphaproteobacteria bacterium]
MRWKPANALAMLAVALLVAGCGVDPGSNNASQAVASTDEWRDNYGGPGTEGWATATNQVEWVTLWASLGVEPPAVLGDGLVGIGVFLGLRNTGGFGITIDSQQDEDGTYVVRYSEVEPGPGAIVTMALTAPYVIWTIADPGLAIIVEKTTP